jgi:hypothetical protein
MADQNPTVDPRVVPVDLPTWQVAILRDDLCGGLAGLLEDLEKPEKLPDPEAAVREAAVFRRLLTALDEGWIALPDEEARGRIERMADGFDEANDYAPTVATHDGHRALLDLLGGAGRERGCVR